MSIILRKNRVVFRVEGPEASKLLSDVLTGGIPSAPNEANWWALLSPQGKIQAEGLIGLHGDAFWLDVCAKISQSFFKRMRMYKLRAKAEITNLSDSHFIGWSEQMPDQSDIIFHKDQRDTGLGYRVICEQGKTMDWTEDDQLASQKRVNLGIAELGMDFSVDSLFPHDIGMDLLGGIDFAKGCYVGQEVVSRMQHRGAARRRPVVVCVSAGEMGDTIQIGEKSVGTIGEVVNDRAVGMVRLDRITDPTQTTVNGHPVTLEVPSWAGYVFLSDSKPDSLDNPTGT